MIKLKHVTVLIEQDTYPINPREEHDNLTTIAVYTNRYVIGEETITCELQDTITKNRSTEYLPVYCYHHSTALIATVPFSCPWGSGQIGYIYTTKDRIESEFKQQQWRKKAKEILQAEFAEYKMYIEGDIYVITVKNNYSEEILESFSGFIGTIEGAHKEALELAEQYEQKTEKMCHKLVHSVN